MSRFSKTAGILAGVASILGAGGAAAETGRLRCGDNLAGTGFAIVVDVDLDRGTAYITFDSEYPAQRSNLVVTDRYLTWALTRQTAVENRLDRATGILTWRSAGRGGEWLSAGTCTRMKGGGGVI